MALLDSLVRTQSQWASAHFERALTLAASGRGKDAVEALRRTVQLKPDHTEAWRVLADHLMTLGDAVGADGAYANHIRSSTRDPGMLKAAAAMAKNDVAIAERLLKAHLKKAPTDVAAIRMLAEVAVRCGREPEAERLIIRCLELAPGFTAARYNYAVLLHRANDSDSALEQIEQCLAVEPDSPSYRNLCAVILSRIGEYERSRTIYSRLLSEYPDNAKVWLSYGHVLKTEGRQDECIEAYRKSIERRPAFGEAYWSLANLKTFEFSSSDIEAMNAQLSQTELRDEDAWHLHFALGKACEDSGNFVQSFKHYAEGNALYRTANPYDADNNTVRAERLKISFSHQFFEERAGVGCDAPDAIFIVGMPRSGSTLLEQILSCHSAVEGTTELPEIVRIAQELRDEAGSDEVAAHASVLASKSPAELRALGEKYMQRTRIYRKTDKPFFIDKMPNNFLHVGIIQLILPNARIIDARRHPLGCCFSNFKQYYARGQNFSYDLEDMGRFYYDYVDLMAHFDSVLPRRIHRVFYEDTVADTEAVIRRLLEYCGLEFETACLRFFENRRPVRTASSEQVRQPIYSTGTEHWRNFEPWLGPLKRALGPVLEAYPDVPRF
ncbi:MAG: sulfotransferase [Woeseia sp.]